MKKVSLFMAIFILAALLSGCAGGQTKAPEPTPSPPPVDVDLTVLSSTMVYGEVFQMMMEPHAYLGKTIKMRGLYSASYHEPTEQYYHFVVIQDATACCAQGLEFFWMGEHVYPDDYPQDGSELEVTGVWERYEEDGQLWYRIKTDALRW